MQNGLYVGLSGQKTLMRRLETIADNVANMNTVGFRASGVSFAAEVARTGDSRTAFSSTGTDYVSKRAGPLVRTDNLLDVAIQGDGWFGVKSADGTTSYTRDGRMRMSESGALETLNGAKVLDAGGSPIALDPQGGQPRIAEDGMINQGGRQAGAIGIFSVDGGAKLTRVGNSAVVSDLPAKPVLDFTKNRVVQGWIEQSNVNPIEEMTKLISISRTFDSLNAGMNQTDSAVQDAIKTLGGQA